MRGGDIMLETFLTFINQHKFILFKILSFLSFILIFIKPILAFSLFFLTIALLAHWDDLTKSVDEFKKRALNSFILWCVDTPLF